MIILYYSRHGFTKKCAEIIMEHLQGSGEIRMQDMAETGSWTVASGESVVMGFPIYKGCLPSAVKKYLDSHRAELTAGPLAVFLSALSSRKTAEEYLNSLLPPEILKNIQIKGFFGGALVWENLSFIEKILFRMINGLQGNVSNLDLQEIHRFAESLQGMIK